MLSPIQDLREYIDKSHVAGPGDYRSHEEFAHALIDGLASLRLREMPTKDVCSFVSSLRRRESWYETAVLMDLLIVRPNNHFDTYWLGAWRIQSITVQRNKPSYNGLLTIAYDWLGSTNSEHRIFSSADLTGVAKRPTPPEPDWMKHAEGDPPETFEGLHAYFTCLLEDLAQHGGDFAFPFCQHYMATHEPDLLSHNIPLLRDMYMQDSVAQWEKRWARYEEVIDDQKAACGEFHNALNDRLEAAYSVATRLIATRSKSDAMSRLMQRLKEHQSGWL